MVELATIRHLLAEASPVTEDEITPEKHLVKDLELDSFSLLDTVSVFEKEFSISIPDRDLRLFDTVQDVVDYVNKREAE